MTKEYLQHAFIYHRELGIFVWKNPPLGKARLIGQVVGCVDHHNGYRVVRLNRQNYRVHRLVWLFEHGTFPELIDHINGDKLDNRIANLRNCSDRVNNSNTYRHRNGKLVGASWMTKYQRWQSNITVDGRQVLLGYFDSEEDAHRAYGAALRLTSVFGAHQDEGSRQEFVENLKWVGTGIR